MEVSDLSERTEDWKRVLEFLQAIERGEITLELQLPVTMYVRYQASNGWRLVVFNDAGEWDYLEEVAEETNRVLFDFGRDYPEVGTIPHMAWEIGERVPSPEVAERCYHWQRVCREYRQPSTP